MNILATALLAFATFGTAAAALAPTCQDLAGQGFACAEASADPATGVDVDVLVVLEPTVPPLPPPPALAFLAPTCQDLAGQGSACADATVDPATGIDVDVVVIIEPTVPPLPPPPAL